VKADIGGDGTLGERWIVVDQDMVRVLTPNGTRAHVDLEVSLSDINGAKTENLVGGGALTVGKGSDTIELVRYTTPLAGRMSGVARMIEALAKEKGIEPDVVIQAMEEAVLTASRKFYKGDEELKAKFNPENGQIELFAVKTIVEEVTTPAKEISIAEAKEIYGEDAEVEVGYQIEFPKRTDVLGRIAAQTAKQVIFQKVREAERRNVYDEFTSRVGEVITGTVKRFEQGDIIVELGRIEASLPRKEQSRAENYAIGDRVLRPAMVVVARNAETPRDANTDATTDETTNETGREAAGGRD